MNHLIVMHNPVQGHQVMRDSLWPWAKSMLSAGHKLVIRAEELENDKSDRQRRYYHGVVLTEIARHATANGVKYPMPVWKEHFRKEFLGDKRKVFIDPITGRKSRRTVRVSTEDLGVRKYSELIEKVQAFAATELGVTFSVGRWEDFE